MQPEVFLQGLMLGLAYAAPIGIQNMFVINAAMTMQRRRAFVCSLIVAFFDCTLALACFFGVGTFIDIYPAVKTSIMIVGGIVLVYMGGKMLFTAHVHGSTTEIFAPKFITLIWTAFVLTWFNPQAVIDGTMMLGAMYASFAANQRFPFIIGMCAASLLWFAVLVTIISIFKSHISGKVLRYINVLCGGIILLFGARLIFRAI
ncbi:MAG: LysE family transporter [Desulfovibrio sp.]|uniref:LysE/ArgO family amino acid transporter n=1 Tax=Desulfovibrio sp. TaxID=885 RepID=UPI001A7882C3|nr:LysE family transporter [Desulfovibrio sp.]MBD5417915.1 LysE family transporter [Desulfovibrio sp.]